VPPAVAGERVPCRGDRDLHVLRHARRDVAFADTDQWSPPQQQKGQVQ
jgi:hypothetical protein